MAVKERVVLEKTTENVEMYLKAIWLLEEDGKKPVYANEVALLLKISLPSTVEMLSKLENKKYLTYSRKEGIALKEKGKDIAKRIVRNFRLAELFFRDTLKLDPNQEAVCRFEHIITEEMAESLRKLLKNPAECPHGKKIPY